MGFPKTSYSSTSLRKFDLTGASEINRLYPNSRRNRIKEKQYLKTLPRRGRLEEETTERGRNWSTSRGRGMEERRKGGLTAPKRVRGAPKTQWKGKCC
ncbi:hypothetical protein TNCV_4959511 [Trichonephila clavipes]|uniref:Uncharacterized protein n=1 Tax=Trichonephila clavipes TaxID=2585209 RepID=A0A8X6SSF4_TRICX|nr:hypothetical protein TNCV_4959511 [Trichonephila clavipes]